MRYLPRLSKTHPNFFVIFFALAVVFHLGMGLAQVLTPDRYFIASLERVYDVAPIRAWGCLNLVCFALMTIGAYWRFDVFARIGLGLGCFFCLSRGLLIELGPGGPGGGLLVWVPMAVQHWVQMSEPQSNPLTARSSP